MFRSTRVILILIVAIGAALIIIVLPLLHFYHQKTMPALRSGSLTIPVSIADNETSREQGLSGTKSLPANNGKLFVFPESGNYGFWMKDMNYALDFIWLDSNMKIVGITPNVTADTYPNVFYPPSFVQYVLEVNTGFSTTHALTVGQQFTLQK